MLDLTHRPTTGRDLRLLRVYHDVRQGELARALGVSRQRVTQLEGARRPPAGAIARYMAALLALVERP